MRNVPQNLTNLNTWSPVGSALWERLWCGFLTGGGVEVLTVAAGCKIRVCLKTNKQKTRSKNSGYYVFIPLNVTVTHESPSKMGPLVSPKPCS